MQTSNSGQLNPGMDPKDEAPWHMRYGVKIIGTVGGGLALLLGAISVIGSILTISPFCLILSIWQMALGLAVIVIECPYCCVLVEQVKVVTNWIESKPLIVKAGVYTFGPLPTVLFCFSLNTLFGNILIIGAGVLYGFMALGKKADRSEMAHNAQLHAASTVPGATSLPVKVTVINDRNSVPPPKPPPPSYSDSYNPGSYASETPKSNLTGNVGWDTSYLQSSTTDLHVPYNSSSNPAASDKPPNAPFNPFQ